MMKDEVLWESKEGITVIVDPSYGLIRKRGSETDTSNHLANFYGSVEIVGILGDEIASFSGSDEYSGTVELVWKITRKRHHKHPEDDMLADVQLWTLFHSSASSLEEET